MPFLDVQFDHHLVLANGANPTGHTLAARLVLEELGDARAHVGQVGGGIEHHDYAQSPGWFPQPECLRASEAGRATVASRRNQQHRREAPPAGRPPHRQPRRAAHRVWFRRASRRCRDDRQRPRDRTVGYLVNLRCRCDRYASAPSSTIGNTFSKRLGVIDRRRLIEQSVGCRVRRFVARFASEAFDAVEQRRLFAADVGTGTTPNLDVECCARAGDIVAKQPGGSSLVDGVLDACGGQRVLAPDIDPAVLSPSCRLQQSSWLRSAQTGRSP